MKRFNLSDEELLGTYKSAIELKTELAFILLLVEEIEKRNLKAESLTKKEQWDGLKLTTR